MPSLTRRPPPHHHHHLTTITPLLSFSLLIPGLRSSAALLTLLLPAHCPDLGTRVSADSINIALTHVTSKKMAARRFVGLFCIFVVRLFKRSCKGGLMRLLCHLEVFLQRSTVCRHLFTEKALCGGGGLQENKGNLVTEKYN